MTFALQTIREALLAGLDFREAAITPTMDRRLSVVVKELQTLDGLDLGVLRNIRKLYEADPNRHPLRLRDVPELYAELDRVWRKTRARIERAERERAERLAIYEDAPQ